MQISGTALKHGVAADDIEHALRNSLVIEDLEETSGCTWDQGTTALFSRWS